MNNRIRELREKRHLSQLELADRIGVNKQTISQYERGVRYPRKENLEALSDFFNVTIDYLTGKDVVSEMLLDSEEQDIVNAYRALSEDQKVMVRAMLGVRKQ